jgi:hypothetical protein
VPQLASLHAARQLEARQKSMVMLAEPMRAHQAARVLRLSEPPQAAAPLQGPLPLGVRQQAAQQARSPPAWIALLWPQLPWP